MMDPSAVNVNVTVDDFDSVLSYADPSAWQTPDPSSPSFNASASPWRMGTFHKTDVLNATISFNFTGPAIYVFGDSGPSYGSYEIRIDGFSSIFSAYSANNGSIPHLLYGANNFTYAAHTFSLRNLGAREGDAGGNNVLFDVIRATVQLAPSGATVSNTTLEETDPSLRYNGTWGHNKSPNFSGGGSTFTNQDKASVSLDFHGSAVYVLGDKKNDHGLYKVTLDNSTSQIFNGVSGCGGAFGMTCEQQHPTLKYFASNLDGNLHSINIENIAGVNNSFFDLDSIVITVPSSYAPRLLSNSSSLPSSPFSPPPSATVGAKNAALPITLPATSNPFLIFLAFLCLARPFFFHQ